jgi:pimeloyl-ACP methyl ester carboxylesterase
MVRQTMRMSFKVPGRVHGKLGALVLGVLLVGLLVGACSLNYKVADTGGIYDQAARHHGPDQHAIIVIPGILGSTLEASSTGQVVWGAFSGGYAKPNEPDGARLVALPMDSEKTLSELHDDVDATGVLTSIKVRLLGLPVQLKAYFQMIEVLGAGGYRDESLGLAGSIDWGDEHYTCFQFPYDFRRDNVENARRLHEFILEKEAYIREETERRYGVTMAEVKFDIVAHSMGALLARYYLRYGAADLPEDGSLPPLTWAGTKNVDRAILVAPPNAGSIETLVLLVEGRKFAPILPRYSPSVLGTFPALYQLLPRSRHQAVVWADTGEPIEDLLDPQLWQQMLWGLASPAESERLEWLLPETASVAERQAVAFDHQRKSLERARQFAAALDRPAQAPPGLDLILVAGDAVDTPGVISVDRESGRLKIVDKGPGDGTVLRSSALMDERVGTVWQPTLQTPIGWTDTLMLFTNHLGLTRDPIFVDNVLYWLLEDPRNS